MSKIPRNTAYNIIMEQNTTTFYIYFYICLFWRLLLVPAFRLKYWTYISTHLNVTGALEGSRTWIKVKNSCIVLSFVVVDVLLFFCNVSGSMEGNCNLSTTLIQTKISQELLDGLSWNVLVTFTFRRGWILMTLVSLSWGWHFVCFFKLFFCEMSLILLDGFSFWLS